MNPNPMKTEEYPEIAVGFRQRVSFAVSELKQRLQRDYERTYPGLGEIIRVVLDEEEANAWHLSPFPHLLLPDLVEAHIANLNLQPVETKHEKVFERHDSNKFETDEPAFAACALEGEPYKTEKQQLTNG
jgi:hypothetical protein